MKSDKAKKLAYIAGIIDGEGCIIITRSRNTAYDERVKAIEKGGGRPLKNPKPQNEWYYNLRVCVKMTDGKVIDYLYGVFGGVTGYREGDEVRKRQYDWVITGTKAASALKEMLPFLVAKKNQAELGIRFMLKRKQGRPVDQTFDTWCASELKRMHAEPHDSAVVETKRNERQAA